MMKYECYDCSSPHNLYKITLLATNVLSLYMYQTAIGEYGSRYGYGSAIATVLFLIMLVFIGFFLFRMYQDERGDH